MYDWIAHVEPYSWLREQHALPGAINALFAPRLESRIKMSITNPLFTQEGDATPNQSFGRGGANPLLSSTPYHGLGHEDDSFEHQPVDHIIKNPLFGSGLHLQKVCVLHAAVLYHLVHDLIYPTFTI